MLMELMQDGTSQGYLAQNTEFKIVDSNHAMFIGTTTATDSYGLNGYMADMHL